MNVKHFALRSFHGYSHTWQTRHWLNFPVLRLPTLLLYDHNEARWLAMDAGSHAQPSPNNPMDLVPPHRTGDDDTVEGPCSGPHKPPQKRLMQEVHQAEDTTPRRRSTPLAQNSTPVRPLNLRITVPQVEETDPGNDTAEINQDVEDGEHRRLVLFQSDPTPSSEPSQLLAERVLSAVSNPSPPPDFLSFPDIHVNTPPPPELPESQTQSDNTSAATTPLNPITGSSVNDDSTENAPVDSANPVPPPRTLAFSSQPSGTPRQYAVAIEKPLVTESFVDDTLDLPSPDFAATSSVNPLIRSQTDQGGHPVATSEKGKGREIMDDETRDQVAELPTLGALPTKSTSRRRSARRSVSLVERRPASPDGNLLKPLPRRSARLSASPRRTPSPDPTLVLPQISPLCLPTKNARPQLALPEIGVLSTLGGVNERLREAEMEEVRERSGRKRKRRGDANKAAGRQRLGSLSPDSQSVLQQLLPPSRSSSDEDERAKATTSQQFPPGPQRILVNKQPKLPQSAHIQTTEPQPHLGTPLRRVLVSTSMLAEDGGPVGRRFGQTLSKMQPLDDLNRSPRRVPVLTHSSSTAKPVVSQPTVFSQRPSIPSSSSTLPINSKPVAKQRSMSEEPTFSRQPSSETNHRTVLPYPLIQKPSVIPEGPEETRLPNGRASSEPPVTALTSIPRSTLRQPTNPSRIPRIGAKPYSRPVETKPSKLPILTPAKRTVPSLVCPSTLRKRIF